MAEAQSDKSGISCRCELKDDFSVQFVLADERDVEPLEEGERGQTS